MYFIYKRVSEFFRKTSDTTAETAKTVQASADQANASAKSLRDTAKTAVETVTDGFEKTTTMFMIILSCYVAFKATMRLCERFISPRKPQAKVLSSKKYFFDVVTVVILIATIIASILPGGDFMTSLGYLSRYLGFTGIAARITNSIEKVRSKFSSEDSKDDILGDDDDEEDEETDLGDSIADKINSDDLYSRKDMITDAHKLAKCDDAKSIFNYISAAAAGSYTGDAKLARFKAVYEDVLLTRSLSSDTTRKTQSIFSRIYSDMPAISTWSIRSKLIFASCIALGLFVTCCWIYLGRAIIRFFERVPEAKGKNKYGGKGYVKQHPNQRSAAAANTSGSKPKDHVNYDKEEEESEEEDGVEVYEDDGDELAAHLQKIDAKINNLKELQEDYKRKFAKHHVKETKRELDSSMPANWADEFNGESKTVSEKKVESITIDNSKKAQIELLSPEQNESFVAMKIKMTERGLKAPLVAPAPSDFESKMVKYAAMIAQFDKAHRLTKQPEKKRPVQKAAPEKTPEVKTETGVSEPGYRYFGAVIHPQTGAPIGKVDPVGDYLVTCAHVGYDRALKDKPYSVIREEGQYDMVEIEITDFVTLAKIRQKVRVLYVKQTLDCDIMLLEKPAGLTSYRVDLLTKPVLGQNIHLQVLDTKAAGARGRGKVGSVALLGSRHLKHTANTVEGDSGALVWANDKIIGMHGGELRGAKVNYLIPSDMLREALSECSAERVRVKDTYFC